MENNYKTVNNGQGFAIAALVIGILALLFSFIPCLGGAAIFIGSVAVVFGAISLSRAKGPESPKGMGIAGLSLGGIAVVISIIWILFIVGSKGNFFNARNFFDWLKQMDDVEYNIEDDFEDDLESLEDLEKALDELEGAVDEVNKEVDGAVKEVQKEVNDAVNEVKKETSKVIDKDKE